MPQTPALHALQPVRQPSNRRLWRGPFCKIDIGGGLGLHEPETHAPSYHVLLTLARVQVLERDPRQDGKEQVRGDAPHCDRVSKLSRRFMQQSMVGRLISLTPKEFEEYQIVKMASSLDTSVEER